MMAYLRDKHGPICRQWFEDLQPLNMNGGLLEIRTATTVQQTYLQKRCLEPFTEAAQQITGQLVAVRFVHHDPMDDSNNDHPVGNDGVQRPVVVRAGLPAELDEGLILQPDYSFSNFIAGPNNDLAVAAARAVADNPAKTYNPLYIHGSVGQGKTHLLQAICSHILQKRRDFHIVYVSCEKFINQFVDCLRAGEMHAFRHHYRDADMLVIDDIHFLRDNKEQTQEEFFHTFNELHQQQKQIVLSSDAAPHEIPGLTERLISRFSWGVVTRITPPTYETRLAIVYAKSKLLGLELPAEVAEYIARKIDTNARELEGAIKNLQAQTKLLDKPLDLVVARKAMGESPAEPSSRVTFQRIVEVVTDYYGIRVTELQSKRRHKSVTEPRQVCMYLARQRTGLSLEEIGTFFGGRDHTTVMHSVQKIDSLVHTDPNYAGTVEMLSQRVQGIS